MYKTRHQPTDASTTVKNICVHVIIKVTVLTKIDKDTRRSFPSFGYIHPHRFPPHTASIREGGRGGAQNSKKELLAHWVQLDFLVLLCNFWINNNSLVPSPTKKQHPGDFCFFFFHITNICKRGTENTVLLDKHNGEISVKHLFQISKDYKVSHL